MGLLANWLFFPSLSRYASGWGFSNNCLRRLGVWETENATHLRKGNQSFARFQLRNSSTKDAVIVEELSNIEPFDESLTVENNSDELCAICLQNLSNKVRMENYAYFVVYFSSNSSIIFHLAFIYYSRLRALISLDLSRPMDWHTTYGNLELHNIWIIDTRIYLRIWEKCDVLKVYNINFQFSGSAPNLLHMSWNRQIGDWWERTKDRTHLPVRTKNCMLRGVETHFHHKLYVMRLRREGT